MPCLIVVFFILFDKKILKTKIIIKQNYLLKNATALSTIRSGQVKTGVIVKPFPKNLDVWAVIAQ